MTKGKILILASPVQNISNREGDSMRSDSQIKTIIESAFRPLRCVAEIWDYDKKLRFRVFDENEHGVISVPDELLSSLRDDACLASVIAQARSCVAEHHYHLDSWQLV